VDLSKILLHLLRFGKNVAETCFCQDGLNWFKLRFKPLMAETCQHKYQVSQVFSPFGELWHRGSSRRSLYTNHTWEKNFAASDLFKGCVLRGSVGSRNWALYGGICVLLANTLV